MRGRLRIHPGNCSPLLADQTFVLRCSAQPADQTVDLSASQQGIQARCDDTRTTSAQLELVLVLPEHIPGLDAWVPGSKTDRVIHILQTEHAFQHRQPLCGLATIVAGESRVEVLAHVDDDGCSAGTPPEKNIV